MKDSLEFSNALKERLLNKELYIKNLINKLLLLINKIKQNNFLNNQDNDIQMNNKLDDKSLENIEKEFEEFKNTIIDVIYQMKDDLDQYLIQCYKLDNLLEMSEKELNRINKNEEILDNHIENNKKILHEFTVKYDEDLKLKNEIYEIDLIQKNLNAYKSIEELDNELSDLEKELLDKNDILLQISKEIDEKRSFIEIKKYLDSRIKSYDS